MNPGYTIKYNYYIKNREERHQNNKVTDKSVIKTLKLTKRLILVTKYDTI